MGECCHRATRRKPTGTARTLWAARREKQNGESMSSDRHRKEKGDDVG